MESNATVVVQSHSNYADTIDKLTSAIKNAGATVFASIDQAAAAKSVGLDLRPTTLIVWGNPKGGTGLMQAFPLTALDLPMKFVVWDDNGKVNIAYTRASAIGARYDVTGMDVPIAAMDKGLETLSTAASA